MRVKTPTDQIFDLGLSGHEMQESFTDEKYRALAAGNPQGILLQILVDAHWADWLTLVENAPWLRNWLRSNLHAKHQNTNTKAFTPSGAKVDTTRFRQHKIADAIYAEAVWGYGMVNWLRGKHVVAGIDAHTKANTALKTICKLQGVTSPNTARKYLWDDKIYRGCGLLVPCEFGDLDRWLEPLWVEAQDAAAAHHRLCMNQFNF